MPLLSYFAFAACALFYAETEIYLKMRTISLLSSVTYIIVGSVDISSSAQN